MATEPSQATCRSPHVSLCRARSCCTPGPGVGVPEWPQHPGAGQGIPRDTRSLVSAISGAGGDGKRRDGNKLQPQRVKTRALRVTQRIPRLRPAGSQGTNTKGKLGSCCGGGDGFPVPALCPPLTAARGPFPHGPVISKTHTLALVLQPFERLIPATSLPSCGVWLQQRAGTRA